MVLFTTHCRNCAVAVPLLAPSCGRCGAPNRSRLTAVAVAASLGVLVIAIAVAAFVILRGVRIDEPSGPGVDFTWLTKAMDECDAEAMAEPKTLHFLVVPMVSKADDDADWRVKSLNDIGNAILLRQQAMLEGLQEGSLRLSNEEYDFRMRDEATKDIYKWTLSKGVKKFLTPDAEAIKIFKVQFTTKRRPDDEWGAAFTHQAGTCYWVNAIIGN